MPETRAKRSAGADGDQGKKSANLKQKLTESLVDNEDLKLLITLHSTTDVLLKLREDELSQLGVTSRQLAVLTAVQGIGHTSTPLKIARWLDRQPHGISTLVDRMVKVGLVTKTNDLDRKNLVRIGLTAKGKEILDQTRDSGRLQNAMSSLTPDEKQQIMKLLNKLIDGGVQELKKYHYVSDFFRPE
jgi:DNA-binding MarR family transcriptional regulator